MCIICLEPRSNTWRRQFIIGSRLPKYRGLSKMVIISMAKAA
jgi:hypothetical protein